MLSLSDLRTQSWMFGFVIQVITCEVGQDFLSVSHSHPCSPPLFPSVGDDDNFPAVALERDTEGSEGKTVLSTGTGLAKDISHPWFQLTLIKHQYLPLHNDDCSFSFLPLRV